MGENRTNHTYRSFFRRNVFGSLSIEETIKKEVKVSAIIRINGMDSLHLDSNNSSPKEVIDAYNFAKKNAHGLSATRKEELHKINYLPIPKDEPLDWGTGDNEDTFSISFIPESKLPNY